MDIRSGDGDRFLNASRREAASVLVIVSGAHDDGNTTLGKLEMESHVSGVAATFHPPRAYIFNSPVNTDTRTKTKAHRSNRGSTGPRCSFGDPFSAGDTVVQ